MTADESNRQTAIRNVKQALQLTGVPPTEWTYEQRVEYNKELAAELLKYPQSFDAETIQIAQRVQEADYAPLSDNSFLANVELFGKEVGNQAVGLSSLFGNRLVTFGALAVVGILAFEYLQKRAAQ